MGSLNIRAALDNLGASWQFSGSVTAGTEEAWNAVAWEDTRTKPTWAELQAAAPNPLDLARTEKLAAIQTEKVMARDGGFTVGGVFFDSDLSARVAYQELAGKLAADPSYSTQWKASEGVWVTMDAVLFAQVAAAGEAHISAVFTWQAAREQEVANAVAAEDADALAAVSTSYE